MHNIKDEGKKIFHPLTFFNQNNLYNPTKMITFANAEKKIKIMAQKDKDLFLKYLSARLCYGVKVTWDGKHPLTVTPHIYCAIASEDNIDNLPKLLLRPMSSMTEEEKREYERFSHFSIGLAPILMDWIYSHHLDCCGLIEKGIAIEAPEGMYK